MCEYILEEFDEDNSCYCDICNKLETKTDRLYPLEKTTSTGVTFNYWMCQECLPGGVPLEEFYDYDYDIED